MFCLGKNQGMLVNDECSSWYNRVGVFSSQFEIGGKECLYGNGSVREVSQTSPTSECKVSGTECYGGSM